MEFESLIPQSQASNPEESSHIAERSNFLNTNIATDYGVETGVKFLTKKRDSFLPHCLSIVLTSILSRFAWSYSPPC